MDFLKEARVVQEVAQTRYGRGLEDYLTVLESQQTRFQAEENLEMSKNLYELGMETISDYLDLKRSGNQFMPTSLKLNRNSDLQKRHT